MQLRFFGKDSFKMFIVERWFSSQNFHSIEYFFFFFFLRLYLLTHTTDIAENEGLLDDLGWKWNRFTALYDLMTFRFFLMLAGSPEIEDIPHNWTIKGLYWQIFWILLRLLFVCKYVVFIFHIYPWTPVFSSMGGGGWRIIGWFYRETEGVSRHQRIIKGRGGLQKIDCQLTANEWGGGGGGGEHE